MPEKGYTAITISEETYQLLKKFADETHRSIPRAVEHLVKTCEEAKP